MRRILITAVLTSGACAPQTVYVFPGLPAIQRTETVREEQAIEGAKVALAPAASASWRLAVKNETDATLTVLLDESTFTAASGDSGGRLINGNTRRMDIAKAQAPIPIAPGATWSEFVLVEKLAFFEEHEADAQRKGEELGALRVSEPDRERLGTMLINMTAQNRANAVKLLSGGTIRVTVDGANGKQTWAGVVEAK